MRWAWIATLLPVRYTFWQGSSLSVNLIFALPVSFYAILKLASTQRPFLFVSPVLINLLALCWPVLLLFQMNADLGARPNAAATYYLISVFSTTIVFQLFFHKWVRDLKLPQFRSMPRTLELLIFFGFTPLLALFCWEFIFSTPVQHAPVAGWSIGTLELNTLPTWQALLLSAILVPCVLTALLAVAYPCWALRVFARMRLDTAKSGSED